jgi:hypothetical protein
MSNAVEPVTERNITNIRSRRNNFMSHLTPKVGALTKEQHSVCGMNLMSQLATMLGLLLYFHFIMKAAV